MSDRVPQAALDAADLAIGATAALCRAAAPPARLALRVARGTPGVRGAARALQDGGHALRVRAQVAVLAELEVLVPAVVDAVLDRLDLTGLVLRRVDLDRVAQALDVDAVVARADLDAAVGRVDLIGFAEYVVDGIDLPKIIRESSGSVASEGLRQVRLTSFEADRALAQFMDRVMLRRGARREGPLPEGGPGVGGT